MNVNQKLSNILGVDAEPEEKSLEVPKIIPVPSINPEADRENDFNYAQQVLHEIIDKGVDLINDANFFAKEKQDARSVEAAATAQKETRDSVLALVSVHKTKEEIKKMSQVPQAGSSDTNINTALFVGTTSDLLKFTKEANADKSLTKALNAIDITPINTEE